VIKGIRKATVADIDCLVLSLVRAFNNDPIINWVVRQDSKRSQAFDLYFRTILCTMCLPHGEVMTTDECVGGTLWLPSEKAKIGFAQQVSMLPNMIRAVSLRGVKRLMDFVDALDKVHPEERHYHLQFIGVDPEHRGKGLGSALMQPMLDRCDREGCGAYLENTREANLAFYQRHGFEVTGKINPGQGAPPLWLMWRDPQPVSE
jgi:ribosomal protein S18 acetylase RimI-like enzyme